MRFGVPLALAAAALASTALAQRAAPPSLASRSAPKVGWGKPGVPFEQYRSEGVACAKRGYYLDISDTDAAQAFVEGSRKIDNMLTTGSDPSVAMETSLRVARVVEAVRPDVRMREVGGLLQSTVDQCLTELGYTRFRLTEEQRRHLARLRIGTPERHAQLHRLASDPRVLKEQAVAEPQAWVEDKDAGEPTQQPE